MKTIRIIVISIIFVSLSFSALSVTLNRESCGDLSKTYARELVGNWESIDINTHYVLFWLVNKVGFKINKDMSFISTIVFEFGPNVSKRGTLTVEGQYVYLKFDSTNIGNQTLNFEFENPHLFRLDKKFNTSATFEKKK